MFGDFEFKKMSEQDVRESILAPLVRELGYRHSTTNSIITEQTLKYPKLFLGRKKATDPALRGRADYILEVDGRWRWVLEAKEPDTDLNNDDREQAWSYAAHPEVKALYIMVSNGRQFELHLASDGPNAKPVLAFSYEELADKLQTLRNLLSADSLRRDFPSFVLDAGRPLGPGLRSFAKVVKGAFTYTSAPPTVPGLNVAGMSASIDEGALERFEGQMLVYLKLRGSYRQIDEFNRALGLDIFNMTSTDPALSADPTNPTVFANTLNWTVPRGTLMPNPQFGGQIAAPVDLKIATATTASGSIKGAVFSGIFSVTMEIFPLVPRIVLKGDFEVTLS